jgi:hypothetical protein
VCNFLAKTAAHAAVHLCAGVTPPYQHFEPSLNKLEYDWRWAAGATPFGPYGNFEGVSEIMQVIVITDSMGTAQALELQHSCRLIISTSRICSIKCRTRLPAWCMHMDLAW